VYKALKLIPGEKRTLQLNDYQIAWSYLNVLEDEREWQETIFQFLDWFKWYVNPQMAKKMEEIDSSGISMEDEAFAAVIADGLRKEGKSEEEIEEFLLDNNLLSNKE